MNPTPQEWFNLFKHSVMFANVIEDSDGNEMKEYRPQTFAVVEDKAYFETENLGKHTKELNSEYFFSHATGSTGSNLEIQFDYPLLALYESRSVMEAGFGKSLTDRGFKTTYEFELICLIQKDEQKWNDGKITNNEILYNVCPDIINYVMNFVYNGCRAEIVKDTVNIGYKWYHRDLLPEMVSEGVIDSFIIDERSTSIYQKELTRANQSTVLLPEIEEYSGKLVGRVALISFPSLCQTANSANFNSKLISDV